MAWRSGVPKPSHEDPKSGWFTLDSDMVQNSDPGRGIRPQLSDRRRNEGFDTTPVRHRITTFGLEVVCFHARVALIHSTLLDPLWLAFSIVVRSRPSVSNLDLARARCACVKIDYRRSPRIAPISVCRSGKHGNSKNLGEERAMQPLI